MARIRSRTPAGCGGAPRPRQPSTAADEVACSERRTAVVVNLERPDAWAVALSSGILSAQVDGPQLGVAVDRLPPETRAYLENVAPTTVYVVGGAEFVGPAVAEELSRS